VKICSGTDILKMSETEILKICGLTKFWISVLKLKSLNFLEQKFWKVYCGTEILQICLELKFW
jgi:hypothetical protein